MKTTVLVFAVLVIGLRGAACGPDSGTDDAETGELLECFDADHPIEPTFDTPEAALEHALELDAGEFRVPERLRDYGRVEPSDGWIEFEFRESEDHDAVWSVTQDPDGRWGTVSLHGCFPAAG